MKNISFLLMFLIIACQTTTHQPVVSDPSDTRAWAKFHREWIDLDADHYRLYVFHNIKEFNAAPEDVKRQGIEKWQTFYLQAPWPPDNPPKKQKAGPYISDKKIKEEAMEIIPLILQGFITDALY